MSRESHGNDTAKIHDGKTSRTKTSAEKSSRRVYFSKRGTAIKSAKFVGESVEEHGKEDLLSYDREFRNIDHINAAIKPLMSDLSKNALFASTQAMFDSILPFPGIGHAIEGLATMKDISKGTVNKIGGEYKGLFKVEKSGSPSEWLRSKGKRRKFARWSPNLIMLMSCFRRLGFFNEILDAKFRGISKNETMANKYFGPDTRILMADPPFRPHEESSDSSALQRRLGQLPAGPLKAFP